CVLYELLTSQPPFTGDSPVSIAYQHVREDPIPPTEVDPQVPDWLEDITLRALTKDREQRYQNAAEVRSDRQRGLAGWPSKAGTMARVAAGATTALPPGAEQPYGEYDDYDDYADSMRKGGAGKAALWLLLALGVIGSLILAFWLFPRTDMDTTEGAIPDVVGVAEEEARTTLEGEGFENITTEEQSGEEAEGGTVLETDPEAGKEIPVSDPVTLMVSSGPGEVEIPDVEGQSETDAMNTLNEA